MMYKMVYKIRWGEGVQFSKIAIAQIGQPSQKNFRNGENEDFFEKNQLTQADLNRWFEESDLDVARLAAAAAVRAIEDWLDEEVVDFDPEEGQPSTTLPSQQFFSSYN